MEATTQDHRAWIGDSPVDPVTLEFYRHLFTELTEEMGAALRRAAFSPYIKERRDYSCALFSPDGTSVAMGDHMPVHLGTMPLSVSAALDDLGVLEPGDVACVNDPFRGETHLPDVTLIAPVYGSGTADLLGFVASRTHHSDMGGATPGSMPLAREIHEEGFRIPPRPNRARGRACRRPLAPRARERAHTGGAGRGPGRTARRPARGPEATRGTRVPPGSRGSLGRHGRPWSATPTGWCRRGWPGSYPAATRARISGRTTCSGAAPSPFGSGWRAVSGAAPRTGSPTT